MDFTHPHLDFPLWHHSEPSLSQREQKGSINSFSSGIVSLSYQACGGYLLVEVLAGNGNFEK